MAAGEDTCKTGLASRDGVGGRDTQEVEEESVSPVVDRAQVAHDGEGQSGTYHNVVASSSPQRSFAVEHIKIHTVHIGITVVIYDILLHRNRRKVRLLVQALYGTKVLMGSIASSSRYHALGLTCCRKSHHRGQCQSHYRRGKLRTCSVHLKRQFHSNLTDATFSPWSRTEAHPAVGLLVRLSRRDAGVVGQKGRVGIHADARHQVKPYVLAQLHGIGLGSVRWVVPCSDQCVEGSNKAASVCAGCTSLPTTCNRFWGSMCSLLIMQDIRPRGVPTWVPKEIDLEECRLHLHIAHGTAAH